MLRRAISLALASAIALAQGPHSAQGGADITVRSGAPVPNALVLWRGPDGVGHLELTGPDGHLRLPGLPPGVYRFRVDSSTNLPSLGQREVEATISPGRTASIVLSSTSMLNAGSVEGIVTDETGKPVPGITLALLAPSLRSPATRTAQTDALGRYRFDGVPPVVRILTSFAPEQAAIAGKSYQPTEIERVELSAGATRQLNLQVTSTPVYRIRGHVTNKPDTEPSFAAVKLCEGDDKNTLALRVPVASDGTFEAPGFVPGNYCVHLEVGADSTQNSYAVVANVRDRDTDQVELKAWAPFVP